jgi:hypothetical protein
MLLAINYVITALLILLILRSSRPQDAIPYVLASGVLSLPILLLGNSVNAGLFAVDLTLAVYYIRFWREQKIQ